MAALHKTGRARRPPPEVERTISRAGVTYRLQRVRCGKPTCGRCKGGAAHGPYWYAFTWSQGRTKSTYVGKRLPPAVAGDDQGDVEQLPELRQLGAADIRYGCSGQPGGSWRDCRDRDEATVRLVDVGGRPGRAMCDRCADSFRRRCRRNGLPRPRFVPFIR